MICEECCDIRRVRPIKERCRIAMVLNQAQKCSILVWDFEFEEMSRPCAECPMEHVNVLTEEPGQVCPPGTVKRRSQTPLFTLSAKQKALCLDAGHVDLKICPILA